MAADNEDETRKAIEPFIMQDKQEKGRCNINYKGGNTDNWETIEIQSNVLASNFVLWYPWLVIVS